MLRNLGISAIPLHGKLTQVSRQHLSILSSTLSILSSSLSILSSTLSILSSTLSILGFSLQPKRLGSLNKFKSKAHNVLVATDVASRGLDIPHVDVVINLDIPTHSKVSVVMGCGL